MLAMNVTRRERVGPGAALALLLILTSAGVPVRGHAHHDGDGSHVGAPDHQHGVVVVRHDMRVERASPPAMPAAAVSESPLPLPSLREAVPAAREEAGPRSRAPPASRPRAPPA